MSEFTFLRTKTLSAALLLGFQCWAFAAISQPDNQSEAINALFEDATVSMPATFQFGTAIRMKIENSGKGDQAKSEMIYTMRYAESGSYIGLFPELIDQLPPPIASMVLVDFDAQRMVSFLPFSQQKMAMIHPLPQKNLSSEEIGKLQETTFEPTGKEKKIAGYTCQQYQMAGSGMRGMVWISPDLDINFQKSFQALGLKFEIGDKGSKIPKGFIMAFETEPSAGGEISRMEVLEVNLDQPYSLDTSSYTFTTMPLVVDEE